jgi:hypothetical protein
MSAGIRSPAADAEEGTSSQGEVRRSTRQRSTGTAVVERGRCEKCFKCIDGERCIVRGKSGGAPVKSGRAAVEPERSLPKRPMADRMPPREGDCHWEIFHYDDVPALRKWLEEQARVTGSPPSQRAL